MNSDEYKSKVERIYQVKLAKYKDNIIDDAFKLILYEEAENEVLQSLKYDGRKADTSETDI